MGFNYAMCGYGSVEEMVKDMCVGEDKQLEAFARFVKYVPKLEAALSKKKTPETAPAPAPAPVQEVVPQAEEELVDDGALVAVIAAAIAAAENTSTDSFVVRSIRKSNRRSWK